MTAPQCADVEAQKFESNPAPESLPARARKLALRLMALAAGTAVVMGLVYAAGKFLVPLTDSTDKAILAVLNPDHYVPGLDQFIRAATDYSNVFIVLPLLSWMIAAALYAWLPQAKPVLTALLALATLLLAGFAAAGRIWPNETYVGANVLLVLGLLAFMGGCAWFFHRNGRDTIRRWAWAAAIAVASGLFTGVFVTNTLKDAVARPRPLNDANKPWNEVVRTIPDEVLRGANSFPSGHTTGTFALVTPLFWHARSPKIRAGLLGWGALQAFARVYTAAHFPLCVLAGATLGFAMGTLFYFCLGGTGLRGAGDGTNLNQV
ncbi:MAG: phosphatase PAP2 family protein [Candidatus Hydrogenedentes bacterium]|nr:phosphatase PAP2 family protein [Candidatus Hydrogenedentota bacterium]